MATVKENYTWKTQLGYFSTEAMSFIDKPEDEQDYVNLYSDTSDPDNLILADKNFLCETLVFYGFTIPDILNDEPTEEENYEKEKKKITEKYSSPWNGVNAGLLVTLQMAMVSALCSKIPDEDKIQQLKTQYDDQLTAMKKDFDSLNAKYNLEL